MRALMCNNFGSFEDLSLHDLPDLDPLADEVIIEVKAAGINFPDLLTIRGEYQYKPSLPFIPGTEISGIVTRLGRSIKSRKVGDEVIAVHMGGFASQIAVPELGTFLKPKNLSFEQGAGFATTYGTGYYALKQRGKLQPLETVLILGAAGGVGVAAIQIAKAIGARVIAAASTEDKLDFARKAGADLCVNYVHEDLKQRVKELTHGGGADLVYDSVGGELSEKAFRATAWDGRFLIIGFAAGEIAKIPLNLPLLKGASLIGVNWGGWIGRDSNASHKNFSELTDMINKGIFSPLISETYPLHDYKHAFSKIANRSALGKIVLTMTPGE